MLKYKFDVLDTLKESGYTTTKLRKEKLLGGKCDPVFKTWGNGRNHST